MAPPSLTQLQDENNQPIARYMVDISGAILSQQPDTRGSFSTLVFQVQNASSEDLYYYWVVSILNYNITIVLVLLLTLPTPWAHLCAHIK